MDGRLLLNFVLVTVALLSVLMYIRVGISTHIKGAEWAHSFFKEFRRFWIFTSLYLILQLIQYVRTRDLAYLRDMAVITIWALVAALALHPRTGFLTRMDHSGRYVLVDRKRTEVFAWVWGLSYFLVLMWPLLSEFFRFPGW